MRKIIRLIDANVNRCMEGLRVLEDINRFILDDAYITKSLKNIRHNLIKAFYELPISLKERFSARDILRDVGKFSNRQEFLRRSYLDIYFINLQRVKESLRVLEEFSKLYNSDVSKKFKILRYKIYELEKKTAIKI